MITSKINPPAAGINAVTVTDIDIKFTSMITLMIKWVFASAIASFVLLLIIGLPLAVVLTLLRS